MVPVLRLLRSPVYPVAIAALRSRSLSSSAAFSVKVHKTISCGSASPAVSKWRVRRTRVSVLPAPGPAIRRTGPSVVATAFRCASSSRLTTAARGAIAVVRAAVVVQPESRLTVAEDVGDGAVRLAGVEHRGRRVVAKVEQRDR